MKRLVHITLVLLIGLLGFSALAVAPAEAVTVRGGIYAGTGLGDSSGPSGLAPTQPPLSASTTLSPWTGTEAPVPSGGIAGSATIDDVSCGSICAAWGDYEDADDLSHWPYGRCRTGPGA